MSAKRESLSLWATEDSDGLPPWCEGLRPHQATAIEECIEAYRSGIRLVVLDGPTGSGKTLVGEMVRRRMGLRGIYACSTKGLQDQFMADFPEAAVLKGRANYPTADLGFGTTFERISAADCTYRRAELPACGSCPPQTFDEDNLSGIEDHRTVPHCNWCHPVGACPYRGAKANALGSRLAVLNTAYLLAEANSVAALTQNRGLVVVDECDTLESALMNYVEVGLSARMVEKLGCGVPEKKTVAASYAEWIVTRAVPSIRQRLERLGSKPPDDIKANRERETLRRTREAFERIVDEVAEGNWIYDGYDPDGRVKNASDKVGRVIFRPVRVAEHGDPYLWRHCERWLLMSATTIAPQVMVDELGWVGGWKVVQMPATFPTERRKVKVFAGPDMARRNKDTSWPQMVKMVGEVVDHHPDDRVLVHAVSYELATMIAEGIKRGRSRDVLTYRSALERESTLNEFKKTEGAVLVAPSMDRGVDLPDEMCRVIVIAKVPFPNLGDRQINARLRSAGGQIWYSAATIRSLVQMTGRGMRHEGDFVTSYILDRQFIDRTWKKDRRLLPDWWQESLDWSGRFDSVTDLY